MKEKNKWIFQANPDRFDILSALSNKVYTWDNWKVKQHKDKIKKGDLAIIWVSGKDAGIYAIGNITTDPFRTNKYNLACDGYFTDNEIGEKEKAESLDKGILKITINYTKRFPCSPIYKNNCRIIAGLQNLSVIKQPWAGTNFKVTDGEWQIISKLIKLK